MITRTAQSDENMMNQQREGLSVLYNRYLILTNTTRILPDGLISSAELHTIDVQMEQSL